MQVNQVRSTLTGAITDVEAATSQLYTVRQLLENALQATTLVRNTSIDPIGIPILRQMIEDIDRLFPLAAKYADETTTYINTL